MSKQIIYNPEACRRMMLGVDTVARAASVTFGSEGPAVVIQHRTTGIMPIFTRDGVTVVNAIVMEDRIADLGGRMLRDVANAVSREAGDGTTTAVVLAQNLAAECLKSVTAGFHPLQLKKGLDLGITLIEQYLAENAHHWNSVDWIEKITAIATKNEAGVGELLIEAFDELGLHGKLTFQLGNSQQDVLDITEGIFYEQGVLSPHFITDKTRGEAVLDDPYILLYDREISDFMDLVPILEEIQAENRSLLTIAEDIKDKALSGLLLNHAQGIFKVVAVKPPSFGDKRIDRLKDLAILTSGQALLEESGSLLEQVSLEQLGQAKRVVVTDSTITIIGNVGDKEKITTLSTALEKQADIIRNKKAGDGSPTGNMHDLEELEERIAMLCEKTGVFQVGGVVDFEIKERLVRIENAYNAVKAAMEEGVLAGCGVGLWHCQTAIDNVISENAHQQQGLEILKHTLAAPFKQLVRNAGLNSETVISQLEVLNDVNMTFDTHQRCYGDFIEMGVMDSVKVIRLALKSAVSVITTMMTSDTVVMNVADTSMMSGYTAEWAASTRENPRA